MPDLTRRQAAGDLALWYDEAAGAEWLRALPVGNGRLGAMVFGNTDTERLQLNEDTVWAGGRTTTTTRGARVLSRRSGGGHHRWRTHLPMDSHRRPQPEIPAPTRPAEGGT